MKNRVLVLVMGCMLVMAGCGSVGATTPAENGAEPAATESASETADAESAEETEDTATDSESTEENTEDAGAEGDGFVDEFTIGEETAPDANGKISNGFMSITMPAELEGKYIAFCKDGEINVYEKESYDAKFGGFCFGIYVTTSFEDYGGMRTKIGELTDKDGQVYNVLIEYPSDVQWDYEKNDEMPEAYRALYEGARDIVATLEPDQGGEYVDGAGTKGETIFADKAKEIVGIIENAKDANELEAADLSPVYYAVTQGDDAKDPMETMGIAYFDSNSNGVDEMFVGDIETGQIYDMFASVDGKPAHVVSGNFRDYFKANGYGVREYILESAGVSVIKSSILSSNTTEFIPQYAIKLDETDTAEHKWSVSYDDAAENWEEITEEDYNMDLSNMEAEGDVEVKFVPLKNFK
ncbi:hypothetical protein [Butyrivibrio sp. AE3004]|uniref:hypothetical protein n=1 Tax=Butyrivibrio sp. AE3004 TaxID=1506994 RepID=UPI0012DD5F57|nr:hypothetical protein [Butyrivibrio sp. AE3004]